MNVKIFRLNSGEEILSRFEEQNDCFILKNPSVLVPVGKGQIGMMPWMPYTKADKGISVPKSFVAFSVDALDELKAQYDQTINTGIVTPSGGINSSSGLKLTT
jgi:hypothetical protein